MRRDDVLDVSYRKKEEREKNRTGGKKGKLKCCANANDAEYACVRLREEGLRVQDPRPYQSATLIACLPTVT